MLLAEAPMIDPGVVIMFLVVVTVIAATLVAAVVTTVVAGYRYGRDPSRTKAKGTWVGGLVLEGLVAVPAYASLEPLWIVLMTVVLAISAGARWLGGLGAPTGTRGSPTGRAARGSRR